MSQNFSHGCSPAGTVAGRKMQTSVARFDWLCSMDGQIYAWPPHESLKSAATADGFVVSMRVVW